MTRWWVPLRPARGMSKSYTTEDTHHSVTFHSSIQSNPGVPATFCLYIVFIVMSEPVGPPGAQITAEQADNFEDIEKQFAVKGQHFAIIWTDSPLTFPQSLLR